MPTENARLRAALKKINHLFSEVEVCGGDPCGDCMVAYQSMGFIARAALSAPAPPEHDQDKLRAALLEIREICAGPWLAGATALAIGHGFQPYTGRTIPQVIEEALRDTTAPADEADKLRKYLRYAMEHAGDRTPDPIWAEIRAYLEAAPPDEAIHPEPPIHPCPNCDRPTIPVDRHGLRWVCCHCEWRGEMPVSAVDAAEASIRADQKRRDIAAVRGCQMTGCHIGPLYGAGWNGAIEHAVAAIERGENAK